MIVRKRIMILFMTAALLVSLAAPAYAEEKILAQPVKVLMALGIMENDPAFEDEKAVTRGEFTRMVMHIAGDTGYQGNTVFSDVPEEHPAYDAVMRAASTGLISGVGGDAFLPDEQITFAQAVRMLVDLAGYGSQAEYEGGYPNGYLNIGRRLNLFKSATPEAGLSNIDCADLLYKIIDVPFLKLADLTYSNAEYKADKEWTVLREYQGIRKGKGVVTANSRTALYSTAGTAAGQVKIEDTVYDENGAGAERLLGYKIEFYYRDEDQNAASGRTLIYADKGAYNTEIEISTEDTVYKDGLLTFFDGSRLKSIRIPVTAAVIYNGVAAGTYVTAQNFVPEHGKIVVVDNGDGSGYATVHISAYRTMVVLAVNEAKNLISGKYEEVLDLGDRQPGTEFRIRDDYGNDIPIEMLREWDVLSILDAPDGNFIDIEVSDRKVSGRAEKVEADAITVDGEEYKLCTEFLAAGKTVLPGRSGTFYLDSLGYIAAAALETVENQLAFLTRAVMDDFDETALIQLLLPEGDGIVKTFRCAASVNINGKRYTGTEIIDGLRDIEFLDYHSDGTNILRQVVMYDLDPDGNIKKLILPEAKESDKLYCSYRNIGREIKTKSYGYENSIANRQIVLNKDATIFIVPQDPGMADKDRIYAAKKIDYMLSRTSTEDIVEAYHLSGEKLGADVAVFYVGNASSGDIRNDSPVSVVDRWEIELNADDEIVQKLYLFGSDGEKALEVSPDCDLEQVEVAGDGQTLTKAVGSGDIIRYSQNSSGQVTLVQICYSHADHKTYNYGEFSSAYKYAYRTEKESGLVMSAGLVNGGIPASGVDFDSFELGRFRVYTYDGSVKKNHISAGSVQDILPYNAYRSDCSRLVISRQSDDPRSIVIYND